MLALALILPVLAQLPAPPLSPPAAAPAPTVQVTAAPASYGYGPPQPVQPAAQPAGLSTEAYVFGSLVGAVAVVFGGGAFWSYRQQLALKRLDVKAAGEQYAQGELAKDRDYARTERERLWRKCDEQDKRIETVEAKCEVVRSEKHKCLGQLQLATLTIHDRDHTIRTLTVSQDALRVRYAKLAAEHAKCPRPTTPPPGD